MSFVFYVIVLCLFTWTSNAKEEGGQRDYHTVIDQLARALSNRAQSMKNVTQILDKVIDKPKEKLNISEASLTSSWQQFATANNISLTNDTIFHLPHAPYRPNAPVPVTAPSAPQRVTVPSQRLLNDILVVKSSRRLYVLAIMSIHESLNGQGYECGAIDVNSMVHLGAMLSGLEEVNEQLLEPDLNLGLIVVDTCSADLRTLANLYELFTGTNIQRNDIVAVIHDDPGHLPITEQYLEHLELPVIKTFFPRKKQPLISAVQPLITQPIEAIMDLLKHTKSTCLSVVHDEAFVDFVQDLSDLAFERYMCIDKMLNVSSDSGLNAQQKVVRELLTSEARVVLVLYTERSWRDLIDALNEEMVIAGRFIFATIKSERWHTSRTFLELWPKFDQLLISVGYKPHRNITYYNKLNADFPQMPFPIQWLRQFWTTAFKCHFHGDKTYSEQFSRVCPTQQKLDLSSVSPAFNVAPSSFTIYAVGYALRALVEQNCPGALVRTLSDCLNEPYTPLNQLIRGASFPHPLVRPPTTFFMNATSDGFAQSELVLNKVTFVKDQLVEEELAVWDSETGLSYTAHTSLFVEDRDGSRVQVVSQCPKSSCWGSSAIRRTAKHLPKLMDSIFNMNTLIFSCVAVCWMFVCLMCTYQKMVSSSASQPFWPCASLSFVGCALTSLASTLFVVQPSEPVCAMRLGFYAFCLVTTVAPTFVRVVAGWNYHAVTLKGEPVSYNKPVSSLTQLWTGILLICAQILLVAQWTSFEDLRALNFAQYENQFTWRCLGGAESEYVMLKSCSFATLLCALSFVGAIFRCAAKDFHAVVMSLNVTAVNVAIWYFAPELDFQFRDFMISALMLYLSVSTVISAYCFSPKYPVVELSTINLGETLGDERKGTLMRKTQFVESDMEHRTLQRNCATMQRSIPRSCSQINAMTT